MGMTWVVAGVGYNACSVPSLKLCVRYTIIMRTTSTPSSQRQGMGSSCSSESTRMVTHMGIREGVFEDTFLWSVGSMFLSRKEPCAKALR